MAHCKSYSESQKSPVDRLPSFVQLTMRDETVKGYYGRHIWCRELLFFSLSCDGRTELVTIAFADVFDAAHQVVMRQDQLEEQE